MRCEPRTDLIDGYRRCVRSRTEPDDARVVLLEPSALAADEAMVGVLVPPHGLVEVYGAIQIKARLPITDAAPYRRSIAEARVTQALHLVDEARGVHCVRAVVEAPVQRIAVELQADDENFRVDGRPRLARSERPSEAQNHLKRAA